MKTIAIIQARLGSTRFQNKVLQDIGGKPMIAHVVERVRAVRGLDAVVVAVPNESDARRIGEVLRSPVGVFVDESIPEDDVLGRFVAVASGRDLVLRVTADCPLWAPNIGERVLSAASKASAVYASNVAPGYVDGTDAEAIVRETLDLAHAYTRDPVDREHVTRWVRRHCMAAVVPPQGDYSRHKWSVDTPDDLDRVRRIMAKVKGLMFADTLAACAEAGV